MAFASDSALFTLRRARHRDARRPCPRSTASDRAVATPSRCSHPLLRRPIANAVERARRQVMLRAVGVPQRQYKGVGGCMTRTRLLMVVGLVSCSAMAAWVYAQTRSGVSGRPSPEDFLDIEQLVQGYTHGIDVGPEDASWTFVPDGAFVSERRTVKGEKELKEMYAARRKRHNPKQRHL